MPSRKSLHFANSKTSLWPTIALPAGETWHGTSGKSAPLRDQCIFHWETIALRRLQNFLMRDHGPFNSKSKTLYRYGEFPLGGRRIFCRETNALPR